MQEVHRRLVAGHVVVDRDDVQPVRAERLQNRRHLVRQHRDVAGDRGVGVGAEERRPGVQAHARVDRRAHFLQLEIVAADRDLVDRAVLLALMPDDFRDLCGVDRRRR